MADNEIPALGRLLIRNSYNNKWLDPCKATLRIRSRDNRSWLLIDPKAIRMRDGANSEFIHNDCSFDPRFDAECEFRVVGSVNCPPGLTADEAGSGDGLGSEGQLFNLITGYPPGYDLPDAGEPGFEKLPDAGSPKGYVLKRPALNYAIESYDDSGVTPSYGRGTYANPNYLGSSVFSGGSQITETIFNTGDRPGYFEVLFASYDGEGISVDVYYMGTRIATTCGRVKDRSKIEFYLDQTVGEGEQRVMIRVRGSDGTRWAYQLVGPKTNLAVVNLDNTDLNQFLGVFTEEYVGTPLYPAPCHATVFPLEARLEDGKWYYEFHHYIGPVSDPNVNWQLVLDYTSWLNADKFEVYHNQNRVASTMDPAQELGSLKWWWKPYEFPTEVHDIMVRVTSAERLLDDDMKSWYYTLFCTNTPGYRDNPWPCEEPVAGLQSMGHSSTEDNYDMDNGVDPGVVSIKVVGKGEFQYVVSVFDMDMNLIEAKTGKRTTFVQFLTNTALDGGRRKRITVRIDAPLGSSWEYFVGCPVPILDIEVDDKVIPVCDDEVELVVSDANVTKGAVAQVTVSSNIPAPTDVTFDFVTVDGTAKSLGGSSGLSGTLAVFSVGNANRPYGQAVPNLATFGVQNFPGTAGSLVVDASWERLMNSEYRGTDCSQINTIQAVSSFSTLTPEAKMTVNAWKMKIPDLTNKKWLILGEGEPETEWALKCSNFIQSMRNIYNMTVVQVPWVLTPNYTNTWETILATTDADIITIADSKLWFQNCGFSVSAVYMAGNTARIGQALGTLMRNGAVLHFPMRVFPTDMHRNYWANAALQATFNNLSDERISFDATQRQWRATPQYYVVDHLAHLPGSPLVQGVPTDGVIDAGYNQAQLMVTPENTVQNPDYNSRSGTATLPAGQASMQIPVETLTPAHDNNGRQFYLRISNPVNATIIDPEGTVTILKPSVGESTASDLNFVKTNYSAGAYSQGYNDASNGTNNPTYGCSVTFAIDYSQIADRDHIEIRQPGKIAYLEASGGLVSNTSVRNYHGIAASYPYDPAKTYEYKWEAVEKFNNINDPSAGVFAKLNVAVPNDYSVDNELASVQISAGHLSSNYHPTKYCEWELICFIRDNAGNVLKSNTIKVTLTDHPTRYI